jgi:hypothetical protein
MEIRNRKLSGSRKAESGRGKIKEILSCNPNENAATCGVFV